MATKKASASATLAKPEPIIAEPSSPTGVSRIYDNRELKSLERLLLLAVVDHSDADEWFRGCLDELAAWTGLDQSTVEQLRLDLIRRGLLAYSDEPEKDAAARECTSHWCSPDTRAEHPQRIRVGGPPEQTAT